MLGLLLLQVLASCLWLGHSKVVTSFASCPQFFYEESTPNDALNPQNPAWICQRYSNSYHFATLYDRDRRIPVYSAYKYQPGSGRRPHPWWFVEPQLIKPAYSRDMNTESAIRDKYKITTQAIGESQAIFEDYSNLQGLARGHLSPSSHHSGGNRKMTTFTLTNVVPQNSTLNNDEWSNYETLTMADKSQGCTTTYVITGAVPGNTKVSEERVNVPSHIWSAACCLLDKRRTKSWGAIAENDKNQVEILKVGELEARLTELYRGKKVSLFNNACP